MYLNKLSVNNLMAHQMENALALQRIELIVVGFIKYTDYNLYNWYNLLLNNVPFKIQHCIIYMLSTMN